MTQQNEEKKGRAKTLKEMKENLKKYKSRIIEKEKKENLKKYDEWKEIIEALEKHFPEGYKKEYNFKLTSERKNILADKLEGLLIGFFHQWDGEDKVQQ